MRRLLCWLIGHRWRRLRMNPTRAAWLGHLHTNAGWDCDCTRCGAQWRDYCVEGSTMNVDESSPGAGGER